MKAHSEYIDTGVVWLYNTGSLVAQKNRSTTYHILMKSEKKKKTALIPTHMHISWSSITGSRKLKKRKTGARKRARKI